MHSQHIPSSTYRRMEKAALLARRATWTFRSSCSSILSRREASRERLRSRNDGPVSRKNTHQRTDLAGNAHRASISPRKARPRAVKDSPTAKFFLW